MVLLRSYQLLQATIAEKDEGVRDAQSLVVKVTTKQQTAEEQVSGLQVGQGGKCVAVDGSYHYSALYAQLI